MVGLALSSNAVKDSEEPQWPVISIVFSLKGLSSKLGRYGSAEDVWTIGVKLVHSWCLGGDWEATR